MIERDLPQEPSFIKEKKKLLMDELIFLFF